MTAMVGRSGPGRATDPPPDDAFLASPSSQGSSEWADGSSVADYARSRSNQQEAPRNSWASSGTDDSDDRSTIFGLEQALADQALAHLDELPSPPDPASIDVAEASAAPPQLPQVLPWYDLGAQAWRSLQGSSICTASLKGAEQVWKWGAKHQDKVEGVILTAAYASLSVGTLAQSPTAPPPNNWAQAVKGVGGVSLAALVPLHQLARTHHRTYAHYTSALLHAAGQTAYGLGFSGLVQDPRWNWVLAGFGPGLSAVSTAVDPYLPKGQSQGQRTDQEPLLPLHNPSAATVQTSASAARVWESIPLTISRQSSSQSDVADAARTLRPPTGGTTPHSEAPTNMRRQPPRCPPPRPAHQPPRGHGRTLA